MAVTAIVAATAACPALRDVIDARRLDGAATRLAADVQFVRTEAVARNRAIRLSFHASADATCWIVHTGAAAQCSCDASGAAVCSGGARAIKSVVLPSNERVGVAANVASIVFDPLHGTSTPTGTLRLVDRARPRGPSRRQRRRPGALVHAERRRRLPRLLNLRRLMQRLRFRLARRARGFTLIETMVTVGIAGVLSSVAYPSLEGQVLRARRTDALVALLQAQLAEERYRANNASYGSLAEAGLRGTSPAGYYTVQVASAGTDGYALLASANARQARDAACRHLRLSLVDTALVYASGPTPTTSNPADVNRRCWSR